jgi:hypothetical protein
MEPLTRNLKDCQEVDNKSRRRLLLLSFPFPPSLARRPSHRFFYRAAFFWRDNYSLAAFPSALAFHLLSFRVRAVLRDQETPVEEAGVG